MIAGLPVRMPTSVAPVRSPTSLFVLPKAVNKDLYVSFFREIKIVSIFFDFAVKRGENAGVLCPKSTILRKMMWDEKKFLPMEDFFG